MKFSVFVLFLTVTVTWSKVAKYNNYSVFRLIPTTDEQVNELQELGKLGYDFWKGPSTVNNTVDIVVPPHKISDYNHFVNRLQIESLVYIEDVQKLIEKSNPIKRGGEFNWKRYYRGNEINIWLDKLSKQYPKIVTPLVIGKSYEGRNITGVKISYKERNKAIFLEGGIHAREWISPATVTFILNQLLTSENAAIRNIAENYDWYVFPVVNPDGYDFSFGEFHRLWRKTRKPYTDDCTGADLNRNFDFHWMEGGTSDDPCNEVYGGPKPFSEPESKAIADFILSKKDDFVAYLAFHSYGQDILFPYGYKGFLHHPDNLDEHKVIGNKAKDSLAKRYGTVYKVGNVVDILYPAAGSSIDWARGVADIPISFLFELRDKYGFLLPPQEIIPTSEETLDSLVTIIEEMKALGY